MEILSVIGMLNTFELMLSIVVFFITGHIFKTPEVINIILEPGIW